MIDLFNFGTVGGSLQLDCRTAKVFKGELSANLSVALSGLEEAQMVLLHLYTNSSTLSFSSVTFPSGTTFPTSTTIVVRITKVNALLYGELLASY